LAGAGPSTPPTALPGAQAVKHLLPTPARRLSDGPAHIRACLRHALCATTSAPKGRVWNDARTLGPTGGTKACCLRPAKSRGAHCSVCMRKMCCDTNKTRTAASVGLRCRCVRDTMWTRLAATLEKQQFRRPQRKECRASLASGQTPLPITNLRDATLLCLGTASTSLRLTRRLCPKLSSAILSSKD
jgi:hypothetical protein